MSLCLQLFSFKQKLHILPGVLPGVSSILPDVTGRFGNYISAQTLSDPTELAMEGPKSLY